MSAIVQARAQVLLNSEFRAVAYTSLAASRKMRLTTANGDQATAGTEVPAGNSYATGGLAITFDAATAETGTYSAKVINQQVSYTNMPAVGGGGVVGVEITDNAATPVRIAYGALTAAKVVASGDTLTFPAASVSVSI